MATRSEIEQEIRKSAQTGDWEMVDHLSAVHDQFKDEVKQPDIEDPSFLVGMGKGFNDAYRGIAGAVGADLPKLDDGIEENISKKAGWGEIAGKTAAEIPAAFIPGANTIVGGALIGGGTGALLNEKNRGQNAVLGAVGSAVGSAIPYAGGLIKKALAPFGSTATKEKIISTLLNSKAITDGNGDAIFNRLSSSGELVPGSAPTAAEVAESGGLAALQRYSAQANPEAYSHRAQTQAAARIEALQGIAKTQADIEAAKAAREAVAQELYGKAGNQQVSVNSRLSELLRTPEIKSAANSMNISDASINPFIMSKTPIVVGSKLNPIGRVPLNSLGMPEGTQKFSKSLVTNGNKEVPLIDYATGRKLENNIDVNTLHQIKIGLDKAGNFTPSTAADSLMQSRIFGNKASLLDELDAQSPEYALARKTYQDMSAPINQMEVGQELLTKMRPALAEHGALGRETGNRYAMALNDVRGNLVKQSTGGIKRELEDVMTPTQMDTLNAIASDLARKGNAQDLGREFGSGSNTFQNLAMNGLSEAAGIPSAVSGLLHLIPGSRFGGAALSAAGKKIYQGPEETMRDMIAKALLSPKETARIMSLDKNKDIIEQLLMSKNARALSGFAGAQALKSMQE